MFLLLFKTMIPLVTGFITGLLKSSIETKARQQELLLRKLGVVEKSTESARKYKGKGVAWTRRFLAIIFSVTLLGVICTIILAGILNPDLVINIPQETFKHSIFSFIGLTSPTVVEGYVQLTGLTLVFPLLEVLIVITETIVSFYFGQSANRRN